MSPWKLIALLHSILRMVGIGYWNCAKNKWTGYITKSIELDEFIDKWLTE
ncbi:hypothetical protein BCI9360_04078 [Bacillus sp. CECT 9360]|nr:hypothetical protein BCI9360_04078 [Bacillus sp. CECT 9360]